MTAEGGRRGHVRQGRAQARAGRLERLQVDRGAGERRPVPADRPLVLAHEVAECGHPRREGAAAIMAAIRAELVRAALVTRLPGEPWRGGREDE